MDVSRFAKSKIMRMVLCAFAAISILVPHDVSAEEENRLSYAELGITTSSLAIHPSIGYWWGRTGVRLTGMYFQRDHNEVHFNIGYELCESENVQHSINLLTSRVTGSDPVGDYEYWATGIAYGFAYRGFFFELGLAWPWKDYVGNLADDPVIPCGYFGYVHRFRSR